MTIFLIKTFNQDAMNKFPIYLFIVISLVFTGCLKEQDDLFSESAAVRLNNAIEGIDSSLTRASNGWVMQYFATSESPGYTMLVRFNSNGETVVAAKNELVDNKYTEAKSVYDVIGDYGPVITFNTYNDVLHLFSNPVDPDGTGLSGDYEFMVIDYSDSIIHLKGKKMDTEILMEKIPDDVSWVDYFDVLEQVEDEIIGVEPLYFVSGDDIYYAYDGSSHLFDMVPYTTGEEFTMPFIITYNGLKFYSAFTNSENKSVQFFSLSEDSSKLISKEDANSYFIGADLNLYMENSQDTYAFDTTRMSENFKNPIRILCQKMKETYNGQRNINYLALSYKAGIGHSFNFVTTPTKTIANFGISITRDQSTSDRITIVKQDGIYDTNGSLFISSVVEIDDVWQELEGSYQLVSTLSKKEIKFVDITDATRYFVVIKR